MQTITVSLADRHVHELKARQQCDEDPRSATNAARSSARTPTTGAPNDEKIRTTCSSGPRGI